MSFARLVFLCCWLLALFSARGEEDRFSVFGPAWSDFKLTLSSGHRTEAVGPFYYQEDSGSRHTWALPPLFSSTRDPGVESRELDFLYPVMTYDRYGEQYRWQFFQLFSIAGGPSQTETVRNRYTVFPVFFYQKSSDPGQNYAAYGPFYGYLQHRLMRDEIRYVMFPLYSQTRKKDVVTDNYLYPIFHLRHGDNLRGWQFFPLYGHESKGLTFSTNNFGDVTAIGGHERTFAVWPIYFNEHNQLGTTNAQSEFGVFPFYTELRSPPRDTTTVLWPFFNKIEDRDKQYTEWQALWPLVVVTRGPGKSGTRILPFYGEAHTATHQSRFFLWPLYKFEGIHSPPLDRAEHRVAFFLYSDTTDKNTETRQFARRTYLWPFFAQRRDMDGSTRLQVLALLEPVIRGNRSIERDYSPLWSLWRGEHNARTGASSQSLLWNLYRHESSPQAKKTSLLFGLFQYQSGAGGKQMRLFYLPTGKSRPPSE